MERHGGSIDHTMLIGGQTFFERQYAANPAQHFYQFGKWGNLAYCGAGAYPCSDRKRLSDGLEGDRKRVRTEKGSGLF